MVRAIATFVTIALAASKKRDQSTHVRPGGSTDYTVLAVTEHNPNSFTQGLVYENGIFWEGTGLYGRSKILKIDAASNQVLAERSLSGDYFGEGIAKVKDKIIQLTWRERTIFMYNATDLTPLGTADFDTERHEGWGITYDGTNLIVSDGSPFLFFWDVDGFKEVRRVKVTDANNQPIPMLNELEYVDGYVWANVWLSDDIIKIRPSDGKVVAFYDFSSIYPLPNRKNTDQVLNGIAYDTNNKVFYVTGKQWPKMFKVKF